MKQTMLLTLIFISSLVHAAPVGSRFSYQGELVFNGSPVSGSYDFKFELWNQETGGGILGSALFINEVDVNAGVFTVELDFGDASFSGDDVFIKIQLREGASTGSYTALYPKQRVNATPYAIQADYLAANGATSGQVLKFDGTNWVAGEDNNSTTPWQVVNGGTRFIDGNVAIGSNASASGSTLLQLNSVAGNSPLRIKINNATKMRIHDNGGTSLGGNTIAPINGLTVHGDLLAKSDVNIEGKMDITGDTNAAIATLKLDGANPLRVDVNGLTKLTVLTNGGTGMGGGSGSINDVPVNGLYVAGDIKADSDVNVTGDLTMTTGKVSQGLSSHGFAKAGLKFYCGFSALSIYSSFNNVNSGVFLVTHNVPNYLGHCTITLPFSVSNLYIQTNVDPTASLYFRQALCRKKTGSSNQINCRVSEPNANSVDAIVSLLLF